MKAGVKVAVWSAVGLVLVGVGVWGYRQYNLLLDFCYKITKFQILAFKKDKISIKFFLKFRNQSDVSLTLRGFDVDVYLMDKLLAKVTNPKTIRIKKDSITELDFVTTVNPQNTGIKVSDLTTWVLWYASGQREKLQFRFVVTAKAGVGIVTYPIKQFEIKYNLADLLADNTTPSTCKIE